MIVITGCKYCGKGIKQLSTGRPRLYCSRICRQRYWTGEHREREKNEKNNPKAATCEYCGEIFINKGKTERKYCCRDHLIAARVTGESYHTRFTESERVERGITSQADESVMCIKKLNQTEPLIVDIDKLEKMSLPDDLSLNRIFVICGESNFQGKYDHFSGRVPQTAGLNLMNGDAFVFCNKAKSQVSILQWQGDGFALYFKRAEYGRFLWATGMPSQVIEITLEDLKMLLEYPRLMLRLSGVPTPSVII